MSLTQLADNLRWNDPAEPPPDVDWPVWLRLAAEHGVAPLLYRLWRAEVPRPVQEELRRQAQHTALRNRLLQAQAERILTALESAGVPVILLKGLTLIGTLYPSPELRPVRDLDLLFRLEDLPRADRVLKELGYAKAFVPGLGRKEFLGWRAPKHGQPYWPLGFLGSAWGPAQGPWAGVEPHWRLAEHAPGLGMDLTQAAWGRAQSFTLGSATGLALEPTLRFLHLACHAAFDALKRLLRLVHLYDLTLEAARWETDWEELVSLAQQHQAERYLYAGLYLARRWLAAPVPEETLDALRPPVPRSLYRWLAQAPLAAFLMAPAPSRTAWQKLRLRLYQAQRALKWTRTPAEATRVLAEALVPNAARGVWAWLRGMAVA